MPDLSLHPTAGTCKGRPPPSVLRDIMVYGAYQTKSLRDVPAQMSTGCTQASPGPADTAVPQRPSFETPCFARLRMRPVG